MILFVLNFFLIFFEFKKKKQKFFFDSKDDFMMNIFEHPLQDLDKDDGKRRRSNSDLYIKKGFKFE
jgi:hypothetical protein